MILYLIFIIKIVHSERIDNKLSAIFFKENFKIIL